MLFTHILKYINGIMSFVFSTQMWRQLSHDDIGMIHDIASRIETSLNHHSNTAKPSNICAPFQVRDLYLGSDPPQLQILELSELTKQSFRAILSFSCANDAYLVLSTKVQANPMGTANTSNPSDNDKIIQGNLTTLKNEDIHESSKKSQRTTFLTGANRMLAANKSLIVPMHIRMIDIKIKALIRVSFHAWKGLIIKFLNDPLENVTISTTFDALPRLRSFLQQDIESKLKEAILRDLPDAVYQWSREWINQSLSFKGNQISKNVSDQDVDESTTLRDSSSRIGFTMSLSANSSLSSPAISGSRSGLPCLLEDQKRIGLLHSRSERDTLIHHSPTRYRLTSWLKQGRHLRRDSMRHNLFYFSDLDEGGIESGLYFGRQHEEPRGLRQIISIMNEDENTIIQEDIDINEDIHDRMEFSGNIDTRPIQPLFINARSPDDREESPTSITSIPIFSFFVPRNENVSSLKIEVYKCTANNGNHHNGIGFIHNKPSI